jgi:SAM-dependent methyltransferase
VLSRFSKPLSAVQWFQGDAIRLEDDLYARQNTVELALSNSPLRDCCLLCDTRQDWTDGFSRNGVVYAFCEHCGHVNLNRLPSENFFAGTYGSDESPVYSDEFTSGKMADNYWGVVDQIYVPKAQFLADVLDANGFGDAPVLDFGCGAGHFMQALLKVGFSTVEGLETMPKAVAAASEAGLSESVRLVRHDEYLAILANTSASVVSMMCVLPHLPDPVAALRSLGQNQSVKCTYQKIPMWSVATMIEAATPHRRARVLGQDHTNVFTRTSLEWLEEQVPMKRIGEWWFGQDILDLVRRAALAGNEGFSRQVLKAAAPELDSLQASIDEARLSSELHAVWSL